MMYESDSAYNNYTRGGTNVPAPPKPGEVMMCQWCQQPITPEQLKAETNIMQRKRCFKWHLHPQCFMAMSDQVDRGTPGLIAERKRAEESRQQR